MKLCMCIGSNVYNMHMQHLSRCLEGQGHSMTLKQNCVRPITFLFEVGFLNFFTEMIAILRQHVAHNFKVALLKVKVTAWPWRKIVSGVYLCYLKSDLKTISKKWSPYCDDVSLQDLGRVLEGQGHSMTLHQKSCLPHNFVFWSLILKLFYRNCQHNETMCREQHLGRYLEGQGHSMTLKQNRVRSITLLLDVRFYNISQKWSPYWDDMSRTTFGSLPWRSRSQHDLAAKTCLAHYFVI